ncbi:MAG: tRNA (adenosine(37)-N6)-threonylcarbamoyltransferase complex ATPase subunit type 1 TsaE [Alphaproteobacteria bacterium]|nr:tRNA (adenosine(37)-N6)-threonylcarbamoyltransferase complex ATPase subunit type 1 TsaE [Alphaproteobacteria bacterium]
MIEILLPDLNATRSLARRLAPLLCAGDIIGLAGPLGAGKTTFARALIETLVEIGGAGNLGEVPSPTFTLVQVYETGAVPVWHFDLYRLERPEDAIELAIEEAFASAISLVEWPERLGDLMPGAWLKMNLDRETDISRRAVFHGYGPRGEVLEAALKGDEA